MDNGQEQSEGSARYLELAVLEGLEAGSRRRAHIEALDTMLAAMHTPSPLARTFFTWGMWYETGGILLWTLERLQVEGWIAQIEAGASPWAVARGWLALSHDAEDAALEAAWRRFGRADLEAWAQRLSHEE